MKLIDAIKELKEGKLIRRVAWKDAGFLKCSPPSEEFEGNSIDLVQVVRGAYLYDMKILTSIGWVVLDPEEGQEKIDNLDFAEAIEELKKGRKVKLQAWDNFTFLYLDRNPPHDIICEQTRVVENYMLPHADLIQEDWEILPN